MKSVWQITPLELSNVTDRWKKVTNSQKHTVVKQTYDDQKVTGIILKYSAKVISKSNAQLVTNQSDCFPNRLIKDLTM